MSGLKIFKNIWLFLTNRLFVFFCIVVVLFFALVQRIFELQIVKGESYLNGLNTSVSMPVSVPSTRGTIYDRYGRPLAINETTFSVKIDPSIKPENTTQMLHNLLVLLEKNGEDVIDTFPISQEEPYTFLFNGSATRESRWKKDMLVDLDATASEAMKQLRTYFGVPKDMPNYEARKLLNLRSAVFMERYNYQTITVSQNVKKETIAAIEERNEDYKSVFIDVDYLRVYPEGKYLSHILGYIRGISNEELEYYKDYGYTPTDIIGKDGIEKAFELQLKGKNGEIMVEVQNVGRRVATSVIKEAEPGGKVFLTVDANLQKQVYGILEDTLAQILINKLNNSARDEKPVTVKEAVISMVKANTISVKKLIMSTEDDMVASYNARQYILDALPEGKELTNESELNDARTILTEGIESGAVSLRDMFLIMFEQDVVTYDDSIVERVKKSSAVYLKNLLVEKIQSKELTPQMVNTDPCSGSVVILDVNDGSVLAAVSYPSYDNNEFVNNFNNEYYYNIMNHPTAPMNNRAFVEPRAPGSTFKMISALTGLKMGVITPSSTIHDEGTFTKASAPYANCWIGTSGVRGATHGDVNVVKALEVSCNYFFYEMSYKMGNAKDGNHLSSIYALNDYMRGFGLDDPTGVEIYELYDSSPEGIPNISSPEYMQYLFEKRYGETNTKWLDGQTIRTAIGQSYNRYTAANMAKYIATLANGGTRYKMHLLDKVESYSGQLLTTSEPVIEEQLNIPEQDLRAVYEGMLAVTEGKNGTAKNIFKDFPIRVAGKTGTAQEDEEKNDHVAFACFAPYEDPQIAVYAVIPFGSTKTMSAPAAQVSKRILSEYMGFDLQPETNELNNSLVR